MSLNARARFKQSDYSRTDLDDLTRSTHRTLLIAGSALGTILIGLALLNAQPLPAVTRTATLAQIGRAAQLFHGPLPSLVALPLLSLEVIAWSGVLLLWCVYLWLIWRLRASPLNIRWVAGGAIVLSLLAFIVPPLFSTDIFSYAMFGRLSGVYDLNPYVSTASRAAPGDPLLPYVFWRNIASPYGPLWSLVSWALSHGAATTPLILVVRFKLFAFASAMLDGALIYRIVRERWPDEASWAYLAFAWNPLVLIDGIADGHNDLMILALVLVSATLLIQARPVWAMVGLTASTLIKYSTVPMAGVAFLRVLWRTPRPRRVVFVGRVTVLVLPLVFGTFLPFWAGWTGLMSTFAEPGRGITNPLLRLANWAIAWLTRGHLSLANPTVAVALTMTLFGSWQARELWRDRTRALAATYHDDLAAWSQTLMMFLLVWPRIHTWYALVPAGLALAAGPTHRRLYGQVLILIFLSYLAYI